MQSTAQMEEGEGGRWFIAGEIGEAGVNGTMESSFTVSETDVPIPESVVGTLHSYIDCTGGSRTTETNGVAELILTLNGDAQISPTRWVVIDIYRTILPGEGVSATVTYGEEVIEVIGRPITMRHSQADERDVNEDLPPIKIDGKIEMTGEGRIDFYTLVVVTVSTCGPAQSAENANCDLDDPEDDEVPPDPECPEASEQDAGDALHLRLSTGNFWTRIPVIKTFVDGRPEFDLDFRFDTLRLAGSSLLGPGWRHSYQVELKINAGENSATLISADGRRNHFKRANPDSAWIPPPGRDIVLTQLGNWNSPATVIAADGTVYRFETVEIATITHQRLARIDHPDGRRLTLSYGTSNELTLSEITSSTGRSISFVYASGANGDITITDPDNGETVVTRSSNGVTLITDPLQNTVEYAYGANPFYIQEKLANGRTYKGYYGEEESIPTRELKVVNFDEEGEPVSETTIAKVKCASGFREQDSDGIVAASVDYIDSRGTEITVKRDNLGRYRGTIVYTQQWSGVETYCEYGLGTFSGVNRNRVTRRVDELGHETRYTWTSHGQIASRMNHEGQVESFVYGRLDFPDRVTNRVEPDNHEWHYEYDDKGNLTKVIDPIVEGEGNEDKVISINYDYYPESDKIETMTRTDRNGHVTVRQYDEEGNLTSVTRGAGQLDLTTTYEYYEGTSRVETVTVARGDCDVITEYTYDARGRLLKSIEEPGEENALALTTERHYDGHGNLDWIINPLGYKTKYVYDGRNRLVKTIEDSESGGLAIEASWALDGNGNVTTYTDANGHATSFEYNELNRLVESTDAEGFVTKYERDKAGRLLRVDRAVVATSQPAGEDLRSVSFEYDNLNRRTAKIVDPDELALTTQYEYEAGGSCNCNPATPGRSLPHKIIDPENKVTYLNYDEVDRLQYVVRKVDEQEGDPLGDTDDAITEYIYDPMGNLKHIHGPVGEHTEFEYDQADRRVSKTVHFGEEESFTTHFHYDGADNVDQITLPNGNAFTLTYDKANRLSKAEDTLGDLFAYEYDKNGNVTKRFDGLNATSKTHFWEYVYDRVDRLKEVRDPIIEDTADLFTSYTYDDAGNRKTVTNPKGIITHFNYDDLDRLVEVIEDWQEDPDPEHPTAKTTTTYGYDGINQVTIADHNSNTTTYVYDNALRLHEIVYPSPGGTVTYEYDNAGNLASRTDQRGVETVYDYDDLHHLESRDYTWGQNTRSESFEFDRSGRLKSAANDDYTATFDYDPAGRLVEAVQAFVTDPVSYTVGYDYVVASNDVHRVVSYPSNSREVTHAMDERLRLGGVSGGTGVSATWSHDLANRRDGVTLGNDVTSSFDYDLADRLKNIQHAKDTTKLFDIDYGYDANGNRLYKFFKAVNSTNAMNSRSERYEYDNLDRLTWMERGPMEYYGSEIIMTFLEHPVLAYRQTWDLDRRGNWQEFKRYVGSPLNNPGVTQTREADNVNQYTSIDPDGPSVGSPTCTSGCASPLTPDHDEAGNMTLESSAWDLGSGPEGLEFEYDEENRLTAVKRGSNHNLLMTIAYDALGRRVETVEYWDAETNAAFTTPKHVRHVYDGLQTIEEHVCDSGVTEGECDSPGWALARAFVWGDSSRFPEPVAMIDYTGVGLNVSNTCGTGATTQPAEACDSGTAATGCVYHYLHDALGSVIGLTDCGGNLVERYTYDPYGKTYVEHWDPAASGGAGAWAANGGTLIPEGGGAITPAYSAFGNPFLWTGQRFNAAAGLYHFQFRTYSPTLGRWLQRDPAGYVDGVNLYQYALCNPTKWLDQLGLDLKILDDPDDPAFRKTIEKAIKELEDIPALKAIIEQLRRSKHEHIITKAKKEKGKEEDNKTIPQDDPSKEKKDSEREGQGAGSVIIIDPDKRRLGNGPEEEKDTDTSVSLAHELKHASDFDKGLGEYARKYTNTGCSLIEERAVIIENIVRYVRGFNRRKHYWPWKVSDPGDWPPIGQKRRPTTQPEDDKNRKKPSKDIPIYVDPTPSNCAE